MRDISYAKENFDWFRANQSELVKRYTGKYLVLRDKSVAGAYDTDKEAYSTARATLPGKYIILRCIPGPEAYTITWHGRPLIPSKPC
jgi:cytolysin (calcineurin-like family phosphatase)